LVGSFSFSLADHAPLRAFDLVSTVILAATLFDFDPESFHSADRSAMRFFAMTTTRLGVATWWLRSAQFGSYLSGQADVAKSQAAE